MNRNIPFILGVGLAIYFSCQMDSCNEKWAIQNDRRREICKKICGVHPVETFSEEQCVCNIGLETRKVK
jgi:hypothetical protein